MTIKRIHTGSPFEAKIGYCRAVVAGGFRPMSRAPWGRATTWSRSAAPRWR